jgi:tetratricopeptide (TPR) repeat protein
VALKRCATLLDQGRQTEAWNLCGNDTDDVDKISAVAMLFSRAGDDRHALLGWKRAVALDPESPENNYNLGILAMREGRMQEAERELRAAAGADPGSAQPHAALGSLYSEQGDLDRARGEFRQAVAIDPHDAASREALERIQGTRQ